MPQYSKYTDYTLMETADLPNGGSITRMFNFAAATVTTIFQQKADRHEQQKSWINGASVAVSDAVSVALTSQMQVQKFSEFDTTVELELMHKKLRELKGTPPPLEDVLPPSLNKGCRGLSVQR
jgi:hypothetical protein